jgi:hypothetical protein
MEKLTLILKRTSIAIIAVSAVFSGLAVNAADVKLGQSVEIIKPFSANNYTKTKYDFNVPSFGIEHQVRLSMEVCAPYKKYKAGSGSNPVMQIIVNGNSITQKQLLNKPASFKYMDRYELTWNKGLMWRVLYAQDFEMVKDYDAQYPKDPNPYKYVFDITKFAKPGKNVIVFNYSHVYKTIKLKVRNVELVVARTFMHPMVSNKVIPAPKGKIPVIAVRGRKNEPVKTFLANGGAISVTMNTKKFNFYTRTTVPGGTWKSTTATKAGKYIARGKSGTATWKTAYYTVNRQIDVKADHIMVSDKITNTSGQLLGMYLENWTDFKAPKAKYILGGHNIKGNASQAECENPSAIIETKTDSIGIVPESDIFQAHIYVFRKGDKMGLKDVNLAIQSGKSVTMKWGIYPAANGNYWNVINAIRRNWGVNLLIPGPFAFRSFGRLKGTDADFVKWVKMRNLTMACDSIPSYNPDMVVKLAKKYGDKGRFTKWAHGTAAPKATVFLKNVKRINKYFKKQIPAFNYFCYFHAQVSTLEEGPKLYDDSRAKDAYGKPYYYSSRCLKIYVPTLTSKYGKALWEYVKLIVDKDKLDMNMYWDEESFSMHRFVYSKMWDGNTVVLNPQTFKVARKITCVPLVTQPLKLAITKYVKGKGKMMLANSQAITPTMRAQKILRFAETGSYDNMFKTNLGCIIGLGTHNFEKDAAGTFDQFYQMLKRGGIQYSDWSIPNKMVPKDYFPQYMFPLTPVEIGPGVIFAKERIITCKPGIYSLPGRAKAKRIVTINSKGLVEKANKYVKEVKHGNGYKYELRNPSNYLIVLVK